MRNNPLYSLVHIGMQLFHFISVLVSGTVGSSIASILVSVYTGMQSFHFTVVRSVLFIISCNSKTHEWGKVLSILFGPVWQSLLVHTGKEQNNCTSFHFLHHFYHPLIEMRSCYLRFSSVNTIFQSKCIPN